MNYKFSSLACLAAITLLTGLAFKVEAQTNPAIQTSTITAQNTTDIQQDNTDIQRAKNLARQSAEKENGGLNLYVAESSMHGPAEESPYVNNGDGSWNFTFKGGTPGYTIPSVETAVTVFADGTVRIDYNGPIRYQAAPPLN